MTMIKNIKKIFKGKTILITGGTGSFGTFFVKKLLDLKVLKKIIIYSRDELKQYELKDKLNDTSSVMRFFIGDIRDKERLLFATKDVDFLVHAAALKQVPAAEYNPFECIKTNVLGAQNIVDVAIENKVKKVVALSTDKAALPINLYGASKLASDKLITAANNIVGKSDIKFSVVRYGNVMGSRGSIIPFFLSIKKGPIPITDKRMTRFMLTLNDGIDLVWTAFETMQGGEIYVKKIPSMKITDVALAVNETARQEEVGIRPGEKINEQMIGPEDADYTYEYNTYYKILPSINNWSTDLLRIGNGIKVPEGFIYCSDKNKEWMKISQLKEWIKQNKDVIRKNYI